VDRDRVLSYLKLKPAPERPACPCGLDGFAGRGGVCPVAAWVGFAALALVGMMMVGMVFFPSTPGCNCW